MRKYFDNDCFRHDSVKGADRTVIEACISLLPDERCEKIQKIKRRIESGTYAIDAWKIAGKILEELRQT